MRRKKLANKIVSILMAGMMVTSAPMSVLAEDGVLTETESVMTQSTAEEEISEDTEVDEEISTDEETADEETVDEEITADLSEECVGGGRV